MLILYFIELITAHETWHLNVVYELVAVQTGYDAEIGQKPVNLIGKSGFGLKLTGCFAKSC